MKNTNYKNIAKRDLLNYNSLKASLTTLPQRIALLKGRVEGYSYTFNTKVQKSLDSDGRIVNALDEIHTLEKLLKTNQTRCQIIETALESLDKQDRELIRRYYINRGCKSVFSLSVEMNMERSSLYRKATAALNRFIFSCYGVPQE